MNITQALHRPNLAQLAINTVGYLLSGFCTSAVMEYFNGRESSFFYLIPGLFFGLAIGLAHVRVMDRKLVGLPGAVVLSVFSWGLSLVLCLLVFSIVALYSNFFLGFLCIGTFSAVLTYLLLNVFFQTGLSLYYGLLTGLAGAVAFMIVYSQTDHNIDMVSDFKYLYILWQTLVGFTLSLGLSNKKLIPMMP